MSATSRLLILALGAACVLAALAGASEPQRRENQPIGSSFDIPNVDNADEDNNDLTYEVIAPKRTDYKTLTRIIAADQKLLASSYKDGADAKPATPAVRASSASGADPKPSANADRIKDIALNSREVRLMGPNQREVEMRDDVASKFVVAMDNLQKEASGVWGQVNEKLDKGWTDLKRSEVWGQVNEKLDKGWTDLKTMVEGVVAPNKQQG